MRQAKRAAATWIIGAALLLSGCHPWRSESAAAHFDVDGLHLGMAEEQFPLFCLGTERMPNPQSPAVHFYDGNTAQVDLVMAGFRDGEAITLSFSYYPEKVTAAGGWKVFYDRLVHRLGSPDEPLHSKKEQDGTPAMECQWSYPRLDEVISFRTNNGLVTVAMSNPKRWSREKVDLGY